MEVVFHSSKGATTEELIEKSSIYYELLSEIPTESLQEVFKAAKTKSLHFPKPHSLLKEWELIKASNNAWRDGEQTRIKNQDISQNPYDYPSQEQHVAGMKLIQAVLEGRMNENGVPDMDRANRLMAGIMDGSLVK